MDDQAVMKQVLNKERLAALEEAGLLDTPEEQAFDKYTKLASKVLGVPVSLVSLVDRDRQYFKSQVGLTDIWAEKRETPLSHSFCKYVVATGEPLVIQDARTSELVRDNLAIPDLGVIAYAGVPLHTSEGYTLGSFCAIDSKEHEWTDDEYAILKALAEAVTTEIELRRQLNKSQVEEDRLATLLTTAPVIVFQIDKEGIFLVSRGSGLKALGLEDDQVVGQSALDLYKDNPQIVDSLKRALAGEASSFISEVNDVSFDNRLTPIKADDGSVMGVNGAAYNITERRQNEKRLREQSAALVQSNRQLAVARKQADDANRLKSEFLATMSHELRTPMNAVIGYGDILIKGMLGDMSDKQRSTIERMLINAEHLLSLINDILDLSKIEAGRMDVVKEYISLKDLGKNISAQILSLAQQNNIELRIKVDENMPEKLVGDRERLLQIIINLVGNGIKFTEEGYVEVRMRRVLPDNWAIEVEDTGPGIPSHAQEFIFDEFRQIDSGSERKHGGTGLGLSIVRNLAMMMGGNIRVKSTLGQGSTFIVTLPLITELEEDETEKPALEAAQ